MAISKKVNLVDMQVNTENYRFEPVSSQKEAINVMIENQNEKLYNLAEHIIHNGLNPNDKIQAIVSSHDKSKFNVVEGNRRTVALKLLNNPDLIDNPSYANLKKKFKKLKDDNKSSLITDIECTVYESPSEADKWIKLKHAGQSDGIGTVAWNAQQVDRFDEKVDGKSSVVLQTIKLLEKSASTPEDIKTGLSNLKNSNLERLIGDPAVRAHLGIDVNNGILQSQIEEAEVVRGLSYIVKDLLDPTFKVNRIYTKEDRADYIGKIPSTSHPDKSKTAPKPWLLTGAPAPKPAPKPKPVPKDRDTLIPKSCVLTINNPKVNVLYHELKSLSISKFTNVGAIAFRALIENSMECYIEANKITTLKGGTKPLNKDSRFKTKVIEVANHLEDNNLADKHICKGIRSAINNDNDLLGIETLHAYVHNASFSAIPKNMIITWDNLQAFIEKTWENIK